MGTINWLAVIAAALSMFAVGAVWYSPILFDKAWQKAAGLSDADRGKGNMPMIFGMAFVLTLLMAANLAFFCPDRKRPLASRSPLRSPPVSAGQPSGCR